MEKKINDYFAQNKGAKVVCSTFDNSLFEGQDIRFADAHSQRFDDKTVYVYSIDEDFKKENENLFFEGSKYVYVLVGEKPKKETATKKKKSKQIGFEEPLLTEENNDELVD
jgi:hypothetical protein